MRPQCRQAGCLRLGMKAHVMDVEAVVKARFLVLGRFQCLQHGVHAGVAIDVDVHGKAGVPEGAHARLQHGRGHQPLAVVTVGVAGLAHLHQLREHGAVGEKLHGLGIPDLGAAARQPGLHSLQAGIEGDGLVGRAHGPDASGSV